MTFARKADFRTFSYNNFVQREKKLNSSGMVPHPRSCASWPCWFGLAPSPQLLPQPPRTELTIPPPGLPPTMTTSPEPNEVDAHQFPAAGRLHPTNLGTVQVRWDLRRSPVQPPAQHTVGFEIRPSYSGLYAVPHAPSCLQRDRILLW